MRRLTPLFLIALAACQPQDIFRTQTKPKVQDVSDLTGAEIYADNCASCHGDDAKGGVYPSAPGLTTLSARNGGNFPTRHVMSTIDGYAKGTQRGPMPEFGALLDSEMEVWVDEKGVMTPTPAALVRLAEYLESVQG